MKKSILSIVEVELLVIRIFNVSASLVRFFRLFDISTATIELISILFFLHSFGYFLLLSVIFVFFQGHNRLIAAKTIMQIAV